MNNLYKLSSTLIDIPIGYKESIRYFKGVNTLSFDLSEFHTEINPIVKLDIDFNDETEIITRYYNFSHPNKIVDLISKTFYPNKDYQNSIMFPTFFIKFLNGEEYIYQCPIKIVKNSFFSEFSNVSISDVQFIDNTENSLFVTLDTGRGDILNIKIK